MHYKIYFETKPLFLLDAPATELAPYLDKSNVLYINGLSQNHVENALQSIRSPQTDAVIYYHTPLEELKQAVWNQFTVLQAAGGLVLNEKLEVLFIFRRGHWDLPKGKLDPGETLAQCALREVEEETGLSNLTLTRELLITYHTYEQDDQAILKETHWYLMTATSEADLTAQTEEDIVEAKWVGLDQVPPLLNSAYGAIRDVWEEFQHIKTAATEEEM